MDFSEDEKLLLPSFSEGCRWNAKVQGGILSLSFPDSSSLRIEKKAQNLFWISGASQFIKLLKTTVVFTEITNQANCVISHYPLNELLDLIQEIIIAPSDRQREETTRKELEDYWEEISKLDSTQQETKIRSRIGQDKLRNFMIAKFHRCIITGISTPSLLIASHIKPWRKCCHSKEECLDPENILLLAKNYDAFFDAGLISFSPDDGSLIMSDAIPAETYTKMGIDKTLISRFHRPGRKNISGIIINITSVP